MLKRLAFVLLILVLSTFVFANTVSNTVSETLYAYKSYNFNTEGVIRVTVTDIVAGDTTITGSRLDPFNLNIATNLESGNYTFDAFKIILQTNVGNRINVGVAITPFTNVRDSSKTIVPTINISSSYVTNTNTTGYIESEEVSIYWGYYKRKYRYRPIFEKTSNDNLNGSFRHYFEYICSEVRTNKSHNWNQPYTPFGENGRLPQLKDNYDGPTTTVLYKYTINQADFLAMDEGVNYVSTVVITIGGDA